MAHALAPVFEVYIAFEAFAPAAADDGGHFGQMLFGFFL